MTSRNRGGFTLVELLVVIVIIGMLVGLVTPAVIAARERARQAQCTDHQKNLAAAVIQYELARQQFPGYANRTQWPQGQTPPEASWLVLLLEHLDRRDLWDEWRQGNAVGLADKRIALFVCPSDKPPEPAATSYVANCGQADDVLELEDPYTNYVSKTPPDWNANGVFHRYYSHPGRAKQRPVATSRMTMSDVKDGTQHTLLLSEDIQAGEWIAFTATVPRTPLPVEERFVGMVWCAHAQGPAHQHELVHGGINVGLDVESSDPDYPALMYARPSSFHPGGVIVAFCDGHTQFLSQRLDYSVYQLLMTPDGANAKSYPQNKWEPSGQTTRLTDEMLNP